MLMITVAQAEEMFADRAFSFIEKCGVKATIVPVAGAHVVTAANCVTAHPEYSGLAIYTGANL